MWTSAGIFQGKTRTIQSQEKFSEVAGIATRKSKVRGGNEFYTWIVLIVRVKEYPHQTEIGIRPRVRCGWTYLINLRTSWTMFYFFWRISWRKSGRQFLEFQRDGEILICGELCLWNASEMSASSCSSRSLVPSWVFAKRTWLWDVWLYSDFPSVCCKFLGWAFSQLSVKTKDLRWKVLWQLWATKGHKWLWVSVTRWREFSFPFWSCRICGGKGFLSRFLTHPRLVPLCNV